MNFFRAISKLYNHLTKEDQVVEYKELQEPQKPEETIEEKETILEMTIENPYVNQIRDWAMNKIELLHEADRHRNAKALAAEFHEWINISEGTEQMDYLCLEDTEWTEDQEIDIH
jgi:hypothetical protein